MEYLITLYYHLIDLRIKKVVGILKPDPAIFSLAERLACTKGADILFVDNSKSHIEAARRFGWQTFLYDPRSPEASSSKLKAFFRQN